MNNQDLTERRLIELIDAWGADPAGWPVDARTPAVLAALEDPSPAVGGARRAAHELDLRLARLPQAEPPAGLAGKILAGAPAPRKFRPGWRSGVIGALLPSGQVWPAGAALASLAIGLVIGLQAAETAEPDGTDDEVIYAALGLQTYDAGLGEGLE